MNFGSFFLEGRGLSSKIINKFRQSGQVLSLRMCENAIRSVNRIVN